MLKLRDDLEKAGTFSELSLSPGELDTKPAFCSTLHNINDCINEIKKKALDYDKTNMVKKKFKTSKVKTKINMQL